MFTIPKFLHELLGKRQSLMALVYISLFVLLSGALVSFITFNTWRDLSPFRQIIIWLLFIDISGGVIANLTSGTEAFYANDRKKRWVFILIHFQPILISWLLFEPMYVGFGIYLYTCCSAAFLNMMRGTRDHILLAGFLTGFGIILVLSFSSHVFLLSTIINTLFILKVLFGFSVLFHHK